MITPKHVALFEYTPRIGFRLGRVEPIFDNDFNVTGFQAMSVCSGFGEGGLPVCVQMIAKPFDEATLFRAGHAYEMATKWRRKRPAMVG